MADLYRDPRRLLLAAGCTLVRSGKGDHEIWYSPLTDRNVSVDRGTKSRHTANPSLAQAGLLKAF